MSIFKTLQRWMTGADPDAAASSETEQRVDEKATSGQLAALPESLPMTVEEMQQVAIFAALLAGQDESGKQLHLYDIKRVA